jgi:hypothetical protein
METAKEFTELVRVTKELAAGHGGSANIGKLYVEGTTTF